MPSRPLVECGVAAHDRYGRASNPGGPEARGPSRGLPTCCLYKDLPGHDRRRGQERPVHLLHLPLPAQAGQGHLRDPQAQRQELREAHRQRDQGERAHRVQHPRPGEAAGRGDGRGGPRAARAAGDHRRRTGGREEAAGTHLAGHRDHRHRDGRRLGAHQGAPGAQGEVGDRRRGGAGAFVGPASVPGQRRHHRRLRRRYERVPQEQRTDRDQGFREVFRQGDRGQARQGRHCLLDTHAG